VYLEDCAEAGARAVGLQETGLGPGDEFAPRGDPEVRITEWRFLPGAAMGIHVHALDYSIVYLTGGKLRAVSEAADLIVDVHPGMT